MCGFSSDVHKAANKVKDQVKNATTSNNDDEESQAKQGQLARIQR